MKKKKKDQQYSKIKSIQICEVYVSFELIDWWKQNHVLFTQIPQISEKIKKETAFDGKPETNKTLHTFEIKISTARLCCKASWVLDIKLREQALHPWSRFSDITAFKNNNWKLQKNHHHQSASIISAAKQILFIIAESWTMYYQTHQWHLKLVGMT